ncbi:hypothetical protein SADUNF_Sadunf10G0118000 [Salix dunnii]|uniref:Cytochrome b5 heme-binding domain-containing protein n=2 Tax=Salix TaxID=40685 RepID=A0A835MYL6_9ROSI|nr:hypothetical protein SADUNF_Sadunf10G0118000 [Salix dunnii]
MPTLTKLYTMQEAAQHNTPQDCWVVIDGKFSLRNCVVKKTKRKSPSTLVDDFQIAVEIIETADGWQGFFFALLKMFDKGSLDDLNSLVWLLLYSLERLDALIWANSSLIVMQSHSHVEFDGVRIMIMTVYDVGSYLDEHPGGDDVILATTGKDATDEFEDAGHSESARELLETFFIGELDLSATVIPELEISSKKQTDCTQKLMDLTKQYWAVSVAIAGVSVMVGFLLLRKK